MKTFRTTFRIGIIALIIGVFSSNVLLANSTSDDEPTKKKSKEELAIDKLIETVLVDEQLEEMAADLEAEEILSCSDNVLVKILDENDEVVYEGSYNGFNVTDKTLKKYMSKADLLLNVGNTSYYMLF